MQTRLQAGYFQARPAAGSCVSDACFGGSKGSLSAACLHDTGLLLVFIEQSSHLLQSLLPTFEIFHLAFEMLLSHSCVRRPRWHGKHNNLADLLNESVCNLLACPSPVHAKHLHWSVRHAQAACIQPPGVFQMLDGPLKNPVRQKQAGLQPSIPGHLKSACEALHEAAEPAQPFNHVKFHGIGTQQATNAQLHKLTIMSQKAHFMIASPCQGNILLGLGEHLGIRSHLNAHVGYHDGECRRNCGNHDKRYALPQARSS